MSNSHATSDYASRTAQIVPGLEHLHRMVGLLLSERVPEGGRILVLGAGGGAEIKAIAKLQPTWRFLGVDPSKQMLELAKTTLAEFLEKVEICEGYIDDAPAGPYDGAVCLLTLHFLPQAERQRTIREVANRLKPDAPFVVAHHSFPNVGVDADKWLKRNAAFSASNGFPAEQAHNSIAAIKERLPVLSPEQDEALLRAGGFKGLDLFYAAFTFKGWVGYRA